MRVVDALEAPSRQTSSLTSPSGEAIPLPEPLARVLREAALAFAGGASTVHVIPEQQELTTGEAADLLGVSRPHLVSLLDRDGVPYRMVGSHRRIPAGAFAAYKERLETQAAAAFPDAIDLTEDLGLYQDERRAIGLDE